MVGIVRTHVPELGLVMISIQHIWPQAVLLEIVAVVALVITAVAALAEAPA
jgi:hypothetical protein